MIDRRMIFLTVFLAAGCQDVDASEEGAEDLAPLAQAAPAASGVRQPQYDETGALIRPTDTESWVFLGTGVNLNYVPGGRAPGAPDMMSTTFMEPSAYRHFKETGEWAEGTMTALNVYRAATGVEPAKSGTFLGDNLVFEMSVKDSKRNPKDTWSYWGFTKGGQRGTMHASDQCHDCHAEHAQTDLVFTQFYPNLRQPVTSATR